MSLTQPSPTAPDFRSESIPAAAAESPLPPPCAEPSGVLQGRGRARSALGAVIVIGFVALAFLKLQFSTDAIVEGDGYFHIKFSYLMSHGHGIIRKLPWLYYTIHRDSYRDHHFLQHVLYIPFTFGDLRLGAKWAAWLFATLAVAIFYLVAARRGRWVALILTVVLVGSAEHFLYRMMMPRVQSMSLAMLLLTIWACDSRSPRRLAGIMFAYVWLYDGFILGAVAVVCLVASAWFVERRFDWRLPAWGLGGVIAGMVINPYFPGNVQSYWFNLQRAATDAQIAVKGTGSEWLSYEAWYLLTSAATVWIAFAVGLTAVALCRRPRGTTIGLMIYAFFITALLMKARRYIEIWPPVALMFTAYAWADYWDAATATGAIRTPSIRRWVWTGLLALLTLAFPRNFRAGVEMVQTSPAADYYRGASDYLLKHAAPGTVIFNTDYDDFTRLFFYNSENYYVVGLDQLYMSSHDMQRYIVWKSICEDPLTNPSRYIREWFECEYVVVDRMGGRRDSFILKANKDPNMVRVYQDKYCAVYRILPQAGAGDDSRPPTSPPNRRGT